MASQTRDRRIDLFRGLALLMIFIDHVPGNRLSFLTLQSFAICDAAEVFVLLAGLSAGMAFSPYFRFASWPAATARVLIRCWDLYVAHIVLFCVVAAIVIWAAQTFDNPLYIEQINLLPLFADTGNALIQALTLRYLPNYLDILPLYILLLLLVPFALPLATRFPWAVLAASAGLYAAVQVLAFNLPNYPGDTGWFFNPFAWQFLFVIGLLLGAARRRGWRPSLRLCRWLARASVPVVVVALLIAAPWRHLNGLEEVVLIPWSWLPPVSKTDLSFVRLLNILGLLCLANALIPLDSPRLSHPVSRMLILLGGRSLPVFVTGLVAAVIGGVVFFEAGRGVVSHLMVNGVGIMAMLSVAWIARWLKSEPWRLQRVPKSDSTTVPARLLQRGWGR